MRKDRLAKLIDALVEAPYRYEFLLSKNDSISTGLKKVFSFVFNDPYWSHFHNNKLTDRLFLNRRKSISSMKQRLDIIYLILEHSERAYNGSFSIRKIPDCLNINIPYIFIYSNQNDHIIELLKNSIRKHFPGK